MVKKEEKKYANCHSGHTTDGTAQIGFMSSATVQAECDARHSLAVRIQQLDSEIDALVYQLYGLTEEEIRVVEGKA